MRILLVILIAISGWIGTVQVRTQQQAKAATLAAAEADVVIYVTAWCPVCTQARDYLDARGIAYVAQDIEADPTAYDAYRDLGGTGAVPLIRIGEETLFGFNAEMVDARLNSLPADG